MRLLFSGNNGISRHGLLYVTPYLIACEKTFESNPNSRSCYRAVSCKRSMPRLGLTRALLDDLTQSLIDGCGIRKHLGNIGVQHHDVGAFSILLGILADYRLAEIIFIQHFNFVILFLAHSLSSRAALLAERL